MSYSPKEGISIYETVLEELRSSELLHRVARHTVQSSPIWRANVKLCLRILVKASYPTKELLQKVIDGIFAFQTEYDPSSKDSDLNEALVDLNKRLKA